MEVQASGKGYQARGSHKQKEETNEYELAITAAQAAAIPTPHLHVTASGFLACSFMERAFYSSCFSASRPTSFGHYREAGDDIF